MELSPQVAHCLRRLIVSVRRDIRKRRRLQRVRRTCEGCSTRAIEYYGFGGHPSQIRHMGYGGCLSTEYLQLNSDVSSDNSDTSYCE